jgi:Restriction endonuclease
MVSSGKELEDLTAEIFTALTSDPAESGQVSVEKNVMLDGADGPRQIDVVMRSKAGPIELLTIIECKDYSRTVTVTVVDALHSVQRDVNASKAVLVARGAFSKTAMRKAKRLGISLFRANQLGNVREAVFEVPIYVREVRTTNLNIEGVVHLEAGTTINRDSLMNLNDLDIPKVLQEHLLATPYLHDAPPGVHSWNIPKPWFIRDSTGKRWDMEDLEFRFRVVEVHYFGYLADLKTARHLHGVLEGQSTLLINGDDFLVDYSKDLSKFDSYEDLPATPAITASVAMVPDSIDPDTTSMRAQMLDSP